MSFIESFLATSTTLFFAWVFKTYLEPRLNKGHKKIKRLVKRNGEIKHDTKRS